MAAAPRAWITPGSDGRLAPPPHPVLLPAAAWLEGEAPAGLQFLGDVYADGERSRRLSRQAVGACHALAREALAVLGADEAALPLTLDACSWFVEAGLDRMLRLAEARSVGGELPLSPTAVDWRFRHVRSGRELKRLQKPQAFQWLLLRLCAGASDAPSWTGPGALARRVERLQHRLWLRRVEAAARAAAVPGQWHGARLGRAEALVRRLVPGLRDLPELAQARVARRDTRRRAELAACFEAALGPLRDELRLFGPGLPRLARLFAEAFPESRLEAREENEARFARYFDAARPRGYLTATGQGRYDACVYFFAECRRRGLPSVVIQHGGQYGYEDRIPGFYTLDLGLPSHFASWGFAQAPRLFDGLPLPARIVPLPEPKLSEAPAANRTPPPGPPTVLVPLSKLRTLDNRIGGNAADGAVARLRGAAAAVIRGFVARGGRAIVSYRSAGFDRDPLARVLTALPAEQVEVHDARQAPASRLMAAAHAVFWDVTATGMWETLRAGVPTVALLESGRWAADAVEAAGTLRAAGVVAATGEEACESLWRFAAEPGRFGAALDAARPALDAWALAAPDCEARWREFLDGL
ncbi:MAG: hypothetical protein KJ067_04255 [Vicinamibacteria bacterium]|nr:hypothetical protein [Vicinamibacteria bacterium]